MRKNLSGLLASAAAAALAVGLLPSAATAAPAPEVSPHTKVAMPSKARVVASVRVPGSAGEVDLGEGRPSMEVAPNGRFLLLTGPRGLTKFRIGAHKITRLGTVSAGRFRDFVIHPSGKYAYMVDQLSTGKRPDVVRVIDVRGDRPRVVRNLRLPSASYSGLSVGPRGRTLYSSGYVNRAFDLSRPLHPVLKSANKDIGMLEPRPPSGATVVTSYGMTIATRRANGALTKISEAPFAVPGRSDYIQGVSQLRFAPRSGNLYVESVGVPETCDECGEDSSISLFSLSDMKAKAHAVENTFMRLRGFSPDGRRVYVMSANDGDQSAGRGSLVWFDARLSEKHRVSLTGDVREAAVSQRGATKGLVYAVIWRKDGLRLSALRVR